jgi:hypothetical protein
MNPEEIRQEIKRVTLQDKLFTMGELATEAEISASHVSNFVSSQRQLGPDALRRIVEALKKLGGQHGDLQVIRTQYCQRLMNTVSTLDLRFAITGVPPHELANIEVKQIFVMPPIHHLGGFESDQEIDLLQMDDDEPVKHVLAPVGSGKTMTVRRLIIWLREEKPDILPIFLPLNALNRQNLAGKTTAVGSKLPEDLLDCIVSHWSGDLGARVQDMFREALESNRAYVILDGLDEISTDYFLTARALLERMIEKYFGNGGNRLLVTQRGSRPFGNAANIKHASMAEIGLFNAKQINDLVEQLYELLPVPEYESLSLDPRFEQFKKTILDNSNHNLFGNPFLLTLTTLLFLYQRDCKGILGKPGKAAIFDLFFESIFGFWNNLRSLDGFPTPPTNSLSGQVRIADEPRDEVAKAILQRLAWEMVGVPGKDGQEIHYEREDITDGSAREYLKGLRKDYLVSTPTQSTFREMDGEDAEWAVRFLTRCKDAGILRRKPDAEYLWQFAPHANLIRDWFLAQRLRTRPDVCIQFLDYCTHKPHLVKWKEPVILAMASLGTIHADPDLLKEIVERALKAKPLEDLGSDGSLVLNSQQLQILHGVMPLGLDLCLQLLDESALPSFIEKFILDTARGFFERTDYSVFTAELQPRIIRFLKRAEGKWVADIPQDTHSLQAWLTKVSHESNGALAKEIDRIWRYQTDAGCFKLLFRAVGDRISNDKKLYEKLYRRLVFGLRFVLGDQEQPVSLLVKAKDEHPAGSVINLMAWDSLHKIHLSLKNRGDQPTTIRRLEGILKVSPIQNPVTCICTLNTKLPAEKLVKEMVKFTATTAYDQALRCVSKILSDKTAVEQDVFIDSLLGILQEDKKKSNHRALAAIWLAAVFQHFFKMQDLYMDARFAKVMSVLLKAAEPTEEGQYQTFGARQVYDFAAWAIRAIFNIAGARDLVGLSLPPSPESI